MENIREGWAPGVLRSDGAPAARIEKKNKNGGRVTRNQITGYLEERAHLSRDKRKGEGKLFRLNALRGERGGGEIEGGIGAKRGLITRKLSVLKEENGERSKRATERYDPPQTNEEDWKYSRSGQECADNHCRELRSVNLEESESRGSIATTALTARKLELLIDYAEEGVHHQKE